MKNRLFENENKIDRIGGRLESDYYSFRNSVLIVNAYYIPLFSLLGFSKPEDRDVIIDTLISDGVCAIYNTYRDRINRRIKDGDYPLDRLLSQNVLKKEFETPEKRQKYINGQISRVVSQQFHEAQKICWDRYGYPPTYLKTPLDRCRESLSLTNNGFVINVDEFIRIYKRFLKADESEHKKQHQSAADAINKFFNGSVEITQKELARYFVIESGVVRPNPKSIDIESYMRLGKR